MKTKRLVALGPIGLSAAALIFAPCVQAQIQAAQTPDEVAARIQTLKQQVDAQTRQLEALKRAVAEQEASLNDVRRAVSKEMLATQRGGQGTAAAPEQKPEPQAAQAGAEAAAQAPTPVGQAPEGENIGPLSVARILELPGVLTQKGQFVLEPSLSYSNSSSLRVSLVGYTIIPAVLIGLIDVRDVRRNTYSAALRGSYGVTNRFELEARVPYLYRSDSAVGREFIEGSASDATFFNGSGNGIGDAEVTARYQLNEGGLDKPYYVGSLRFKSRTGRDPYEGTFSTSSAGGVRGEAVQTELPTGSGFYGLQGALTVLYPSDPVVLFGSLNYLYSFPRNDVTINLDDGSQTNFGKIAPGGIIGFNFGMGLGLNDKMSLSLGYDQNSVGKTKINGQSPADAVRLQLGTLLVGFSYRLTNTENLNFTLGVGVTRDAPDVTLSLRRPMSF